LGGTMNKAVTDGLKATIDGMNAAANNLRSQNDVLKERLLLAKEKRAEITEKVASLEAQLSAGAKPEVAVSNTIAAIASANNELSAILSGPNPYSEPVVSEGKAIEDGASTL
jgi:chromosome segregation ATPase